MRPSSTYTWLCSPSHSSRCARQKPGTSEGIETLVSCRVGCAFRPASLTDLASLSQAPRQQAGERVKSELSGVRKNSKRAHRKPKAPTIKAPYLGSGLFPSPGPLMDTGPVHWALPLCQVLKRELGGTGE